MYSIKATCTSQGNSMSSVVDEMNIEYIMEELFINNEIPKKKKMYKEWYDKNRRKNYENRICIGCDKEYKPIRIDQLFCCTKCSDNRWHRTCPEKLKEKNRLANKKYKNLRKLWQENNKEKFKSIQKNSQLKRKYNITLNKLNEMKEIQNHKCAICGTSNPKGKGLHVDHDHITGVVRELLCGNCNTSIGKLKYDLDILKSAIKYIEKHNIKSINIDNKFINQYSNQDNKLNGLLSFGM